MECRNLYDQSMFQASILKVFKNANFLKFR